MNVKRRAFALEIKEVAKGGGFSGYVSIFGTPDTYREVVAKGAFKASLAATAAAGRKLPVLWQHRTDEPIGQWDLLEEDERGLYGEGTLWTEEAPYARIAHRGITVRAISGLSIGYYTVADSFNEAERIRTLTAVDLREASIVTDPAHADARVDQVRAKLAAGEHPTTREFETVLRERGFSHSAAADIAARGFDAWNRREAGPAQAKRSLGDLAQALGSLSLPK